MLRLRTGKSVGIKSSISTKMNPAYTTPDHFQGYPGVLHGGIVTTILDEINGRARMGDPPEPRFMYTV